MARLHRAQARVKRCGKSAPAAKATWSARKTPPGARPERGTGGPPRRPQVGRLDGWPPRRTACRPADRTPPIGRLATTTSSAANKWWLGCTLYWPPLPTIDPCSRPCRVRFASDRKRRLWAIRMAAVANRGDLHDPILVVDQVQPAVVAAARRPRRRERRIERLADPTGFVKERPGDEGIYSWDHLLREVFSERPCRRSGDAEPVWLSRHPLAGGRPAARIVEASSSASMLSPRSRALIPSRWSRSNSASDSTAIVSVGRRSRPPEQNRSSLPVTRDLEPLVSGSCLLDELRELRSSRCNR